MRFIKKQMSLWRIVLIIGAAAIAVLIASHVSPTAKAVDQTAADNELAYAKHSQAKNSRDSKDVVSAGVARPQDDEFDRRRQYWERRIERRLDLREEYLIEQTVDDQNAADTKAGKNQKDNKADKGDPAAEDEEIDQEFQLKQDEIER